jgi:hypothetical protein
MKKTALVFLMIGFALTLYGQEASDFNVELTKDAKGVIIKGYSGTAKDVRIPDTIEGLPVYEIAGRAFFGNENITSVTLPAGIRKVGAGAFSLCKALTTVTIPDSVERIEFGLAVFRGCSKLSVSSQAALKNKGYTGGF